MCFSTFLSVFDGVRRIANVMMRLVAEILSPMSAYVCPVKYMVMSNWPVLLMKKPLTKEYAVMGEISVPST